MEQTNKGNNGLPWDEGEDRHSAGCILGITLFVILFIGILTNLGFAAAVFYGNYNLIPAWMVAFVLTLLIGKAFARVNRRIDLARMKERAGDKSVYFTEGSLLRDIRGASDFFISGSAMIIDAQPGPNLAYPFGIVVSIMLSLALTNDWTWRIDTALFLFALGSLIPRRKDIAIFVSRDTVSKIICRGPVVTICFNKPLLPCLRKVAFYVNKKDRDRFFICLDQILPGMLPQAYQDAAKCYT